MGRGSRRASGPIRGARAGVFGRPNSRSRVGGIGGSGGSGG